jgi:cytochrome P450
MRPSHVPAELVVDFDALGDASIDELHARARRWRAEKGSVLWTDRNGGYWLVIGPEEIREGLSSSTTFDSASRGIKLVDIRPRNALVPIELDGDEHAAYRRLLNPFFSPRRVAQLQDQIRTVARGLLADLRSAGSCDVVNDYARPLASSMFLGLVDWPLEDRKQLELWVGQQVNGVPGVSPTANQRIQSDAMSSIGDYCLRQVELRRESGHHEDMTTMLMESTVHGEPIPDDALVSLLIVLLAGGLDTTQSVTSQVIADFARNPSRQADLREDGARLPAIVEESIRWASPTGPLRAAIRDTELGGVSIKAGDRLNFMVQLANRDPETFDHPEEMDSTRVTNRHLAFGLGAHRCIGSALARVVLAVALEEFHAALPEYRLRESASRLGAVWSMKSVVVEWDPAELPQPVAAS